MLDGLCQDPLAMYIAERRCISGKRTVGIVNMVKSIRIKTLRKQLGLSQDALAEITGVDQKTISDYEVGKGNPTAESLVGLADALNTSADYLLGRTDDPTPPLPTIAGQLANKEARVIDLWRQGKYAQAASVILNDEHALSTARG